MMNVPNVMTFLRILMIPFLIIAYYLPFPIAHVLSSAIFLIACLTDWLDGYLARVLKQETPLGAFLDPVADKLIVAAAVVLIIGHGKFDYLTFPSIVIIGREIAVSALREWMAEIGKRANVAVSWVGKVKTTLQMLALIVLLYCGSQTTDWFITLGYVLFYAAALLTLWSMLAYFRAAWPQLLGKGGVS